MAHCISTALRLQAAIQPIAWHLGPIWIQAGAMRSATAPVTAVYYLPADVGPKAIVRASVKLPCRFFSKLPGTARCSLVLLPSPSLAGCIPTQTPSLAAAFHVMQG